MTVTDAFVLSGGASLGAVQVGMVRALSAAGIEPSVVVGSSVGALNAAWLATHERAAAVDGLEALWRSLGRRDVFPFQPLRGLAGFVGHRPSLLDAGALRRLVRTHLPIGRLEEARIPLGVVVTDVLTGRDVALWEGPAVDALVASAAIPGVFPPVRIGERWWFDGGVSNNTPISHAVGSGAERVWVLSTGWACSLSEPPRGALGMALHALSMVVQARLAADVERYRTEVDLRVVPPPCPLRVSPADFSRTAELIADAHRTTAAWLDAGAPPVPGALSHHH